MGLFGKTKTKPAPPARSTAMTYDQMVEFFGLPPGTSFRDGAFHQFYIPITTRLLEYENKPYQSVELVRTGKQIVVEMSGKPIGEIHWQSHNDVFHVLAHYDSMRAPAVLNHSVGGNSYRITCIDPLWDGSIAT